MLLTGGANLNTPDTTVGHAAEIWSKRDAILASNRLDPYARAKILGLRPYAAVQQLSLKAAPPAPPKQERPLARRFELQEIALVVCAAWNTTMGRMRDLKCSDWHKYGVFAFGGLAREFCTARPSEVAEFMWRKSSRNSYSWVEMSKELYAGHPAYRLRYDAARRALDAIK